MKHLYHADEPDVEAHCVGCPCGAPYRLTSWSDPIPVGVCPFESPVEYREVVE